MTTYRWRRWTLGFAVLLLELFGGPRAHAQADRWAAYTSMRQVQAVDASPSALWVATTGGVFRYAPASGEVERFTTVEGLSAIQASAITYDARRDDVWIGYRDGTLDRLDVEAGTVITYRDIARSTRYPQREVNRIVASGDSVYVATSFGVVVFDPVAGEVRDTYDRFGNLFAGIPVRDVLVASLPGGAAGLWLATDQGVAYAALSAPNLRDPSVWTVEAAGLRAPEVLALATFEGRLYAGTQRDLHVREAGGTYRPLFVTGDPVTTLEAGANRLYGVAQFRLVAVEAGGGARTVDVAGFQNPTSVTVGPSGNVWAGDREGGLLRLEVAAQGPAAVAQQVVPNGPYTNILARLDVDAAGNLWAGGASAPDFGFYKLSPEGEWTNYTGRTFPELQGRSNFQVVHADAQGNVWAGSFGAGLAQVTPAGELRLYGRANSSLSAAQSAGNPDFIIAGGIGSAADGTLWVANTDAADPISVRLPDGSWAALPRPVQCTGNLPPAADYYGELLVDAFGRKWIVVVDRRNLLRVTLGLLQLDTRNTPTNPADDTCRFYAQAEGGLPSGAVTALAEDQDGTLWVGTERGPALIVNDIATLPLRQGARQGEEPYLLFGVAVNDIAVDPANQVWVATDAGLYLVEQAAEGYRVRRHFTASNSPLFANQVTAVAVSPRTGEVFFVVTDEESATGSSGLMSFRGDAVAAVREVQPLRVYPNPLRVGDGQEASAFIDGLVENTELRVLAPHGEVVARLSTRGGRARWDGRDLHGRLVPSGVYVVVAVGQNGEGTAYGKVAVLH